MSTDDTKLDGRAEEFPLVEQALAVILAEPIPARPPRHVLDTLLKRDRHSQERPIDRQTSAKHRGRRFATLALGASVLISLAYFVFFAESGKSGNVVFAQVVANLEKAKTVHWTWHTYIHAAGADGTYKWRLDDREDGFYKGPGYERWVNYDRDGSIWQIVTDDKVKGIQLELRPKLKDARLKQYDAMSEREKRQQAPRNFLLLVPNWLHGEGIRRLDEHENMDGHHVVGFRLNGGTNDSTDVWIDPNTQRVVRVYEPSADVYDPDHDPLAEHEPKGEIHSQELKGRVTKDIEYDVPMDGVSFDVEPPPGYHVTATPKNTLRESTEKDVIEWMRIYAQYNGDRFPESEDEFRLTVQQFELLTKKPENERTPVEQKIMRRISGLDKGEQICPVGQFVIFTAGDTWHYQGRGVDLGDAKIAVAWYKPKGAEFYRVIFGDLSVRELSSDELPSVKR